LCRPCVYQGCGVRPCFGTDPAPSQLYPLSLHDALPIFPRASISVCRFMKILSITAGAAGMYCGSCSRDNALAVELLARAAAAIRSEEHTSELQSLAYLVCRLLLEKKKRNALANVERRKP